MTEKTRRRMVMAEVGRGDDLLSAALAHDPDVALLDIEMPRGDGITSATT